MKKAQAAQKTGGNSSVTDGLEANFHRTAPGEPIVGLEYIVEYNFVDATHDETRFNCYLCEVDSLTGLLKKRPTSGRYMRLADQERMNERLYE